MWQRKHSWNICFWIISSQKKGLQKSWNLKDEIGLAEFFQSPFFLTFSIWFGRKPPWCISLMWFPSFLTQHLSSMVSIHHISKGDGRFFSHFRRRKLDGYTTTSAIYLCFFFSLMLFASPAWNSSNFVYFYEKRWREMQEMSDFPSKRHTMYSNGSASS